MNEIPHRDPSYKALGRVLIGAAAGLFFGKLWQGDPSYTVAFASAGAGLGMLFIAKSMNWRFEIGNDEPIGSENLKYSANNFANNLRVSLQYLAGLSFSPAVELSLPFILNIVQRLM